MSLEALSWAIRQEVYSSSHKFVLIILANYAGDRGIAYPSIETLSKATSLTDDTVRNALNSLVKQGVIEDTGKKAGATQQIRVFRLPEEAWSVAAKDPNGSGVKAPKKPRRSPEEAPNLPVPPSTREQEQYMYSGKPQIQTAKPTLEECVSYGVKIAMPQGQSEAFFDFFTSNGWKVSGRAPMRDWEAAMRTWKRNCVRNEKSTAYMKRYQTPNRPEPLQQTMIPGAGSF